MSSRSVEQRHEVIDASFYDSYVVDFSAGGVQVPDYLQSPHQLFLQYSGDRRVSNMEGEGSIHNAFEVKAIELTVACADECAYNLILRTGWVEWVLASRSFWSKSLSALRADQGDSATVDTARGIVKRYDFENPIIIPARQNFYWNLQLGQNAVKRLQKFERLMPPGYSAMIRVEMIGTLTRDIL